MLNKPKQLNNKGFTIIEVLIVLAIAGLIMLIVFLAVPALQRNSRNTQRRNDAANALAVIQEYANNHDGALPTEIGDITNLTKLGIYIAGDFTLNVACTSTTCAAVADPTTNVVIVNNAKCPIPVPADSAVAISYSNRSSAVIYALETPSGDTNQCIQT